MILIDDDECSDDDYLIVIASTSFECSRLEQANR